MELGWAVGGVFEALNGGVVAEWSFVDWRCGVVA